jgi:hypothetical protein
LHHDVSGWSNGNVRCRSSSSRFSYPDRLPPQHSPSPPSWQPAVLGVAAAVTAFDIELAGDDLRDTLDPRLRS